MTIWTKIIDALLPHSCLGCRCRLLSHERYFCTSCVSRWTHVSLHGDIRDNELARLFWGVFPIEGAASLYVYKPGTSVSELLYSMKYRRKPDLCRMMGHRMAADVLVAELLAAADALVPVPLTVKRQSERQYNQSEEMCWGISEVTGLPIYTDVIQRVRFTESQTAMNHEERHENIRGAFRLADASKVEDRHVVIVDDVITTGSTVAECLLMLRDVKGIRISVLSLAWTHGI